MESTSSNRTHTQSLFARSNQTSIEDPNQVNVAIFYSISSTQKGLNGIDLGHHMIQHVVSELKVEFPHMQKFSSLSPIPNFMEYLISTIHSIQRNEEMKNFIKFWQKFSDFKRLRAYVESNSRFASPKEIPEQNGLFWIRLVHLIRSGEWFKDPVLKELFEQPLMSICAHYLYNEKRRGYALNSVGNK